MSVIALRRTLEQRKGQRDQIKKEVKKFRALRKETITKLEDLHEGQMILQTVSQVTQQQLEYKISELVTLALAAVFPDPYKLDLSFEIKRGKSEAVLSFIPTVKGIDGEKIDPLTASGGGAVDVAALGLRISLWSLRNPKTRKTLVIDEPLRFLSKELQVKASHMIKEISERLGLQILLITHESSLLEAADKVFEVRQPKKVSRVKCVSFR